MTPSGSSPATYTATFLAENSNYRFAVYAVDSKGNKSADSNTASAHTLKDTTPPGTPVLQVSVLGPSQVQLTWTKSTDNIPNNCCVFSFTMNGSSLILTDEKGGMSRVTIADVKQSNGVIHVVDTVLMPN